MAKSFRGKEVDMVKLAKLNEKVIALGNSHTNARGDLIGKGGVIIKTREEQIREYMEAHKIESGDVSMKTEDDKNQLETDEKPVKIASSRKKKTVQQDSNPPEEVIEDAE